MSEVGLDHVGIVLGIKISRLARSSRDWYQLLEVCGLFGDPDRDADGIYDSQNYNDRLLLGLKGTMSCCRSLCFTAQFPNYFVRNARGFPH